MSTLMNIPKNGHDTNKKLSVSHGNWSNWIDDLFNVNPFQPVLANTITSGVAVPKVNVRETKDDYFVDMAVPGMKKEDFNIDVDKDVLSVSAEVKKETENDKDNFTRREFGYTSFKRTFTLPDSIDDDKIKAKYEDGILSIQLPKREEAKPKPARTIKIS